MRIESPAFSDHTQIPEKYTCLGEDIKPPLFIYDFPVETASIVMIVDDPDAPSGTWVHWTVWNIDPSAPDIYENSAPSGAVQGMTSFGRSGYGGPCPPSGVHRYFFKTYALDIELGLSPSATKEELVGAMGGHILDEAELVGLFGSEL